MHPSTKHSVKIESRYNTNFVVTGVTTCGATSDHNVASWHVDNFRFSLILIFELTRYKSGPVITRTIFSKCSPGITRTIFSNTLTTRVLTKPSCHTGPCYNRTRQYRLPCVRLWVHYWSLVRIPLTKGQQYRNIALSWRHHLASYSFRIQNP